MSTENVSVDLARGTALMTMRDVPVLDHGQIANAISGMGPDPKPATVSFRVEWSGGDGVVLIGNGAQGFGGQFLRGRGQMEWSATVGDYHFESAPLASSSSSFAQIGRESNGVFFRGMSA